MPTNVYLQPSIGTGTKLDMLRAKYRDDIAAAGCTYGQLKYGGEPTFMIAVQDIPAALDTTISADATCLACPPLENTVGAGALAGVQTKLEGWNIPGNWIAVGDTYRSVCQVIGHIFEFAQRMEGLGYARLFGGTVTLDTTWGSLAASVRQDIQTAAASFTPPLDTSAVTNNTKLRAILKGFADQRAGVPLVIGPVTV